MSYVSVNLGQIGCIGIHELCFVESTNKLYGTSKQGGANNIGTIFSISKTFDPATLSLVYSFTGGSDGTTPDGGLLLLNNKLYGTSYTSIFYYDLTSNSLHHSTFPYSQCVLYYETTSNLLYGTTLNGGVGGSGQIFSINLDLSVSNFISSNQSLGENSGGFMQLSGTRKLYSMTTGDGANGSGMIYYIDLNNNNAFTRIYSFVGGQQEANSSGKHPAPNSILIEYNGKLYGTCYGAGPLKAGTIFSINPDGTGFVVMHSFTGDNGGGGSKSTLRLYNNKFYSTTSYGGPANDGIIFSINPDGTSFTNLHNFSSMVDGRGPLSPTIADGVLYGTTSTNAYGNGNVYKLQLGTIPSAPTSLSVSGTQVSFTNADASVTNYQYSTNSGTTWTAFSPVDSSSPLNFSFLAGGTYSVLLQAINSVGNSSSAGPVSVEIPPSAPTGLSFSGTQVSFTNADASVTNYQYSTNNGTTWTAFSPVDASSPLNFSFLADGAYSVLLKAVNSAGTSSSAGPVSVAIYTPPPAPTLSATGITIAVTAGASNGSTTTDYQWSTNASTWTTLTTTLTSGTFTLIPSISGLTPGASQLIYVRAINSGLVNGVNASVSITIPTPAYTAPSVTISGAISAGALSSAVTIVTASVNTTLSAGALANTLVKSIDLVSATAITTIPENTFSGCTSLVKITLPPLLTSISANSFDGCSSLSTITIPSSVTTIGANALTGTALKTIVLTGKVKIGKKALAKNKKMVKAKL
jgi:uncharacterized repeat protein (TIGR03803 family)